MVKTGLRLTIWLAAFAAAATSARAGWEVDCGTHCNFSEFTHNCQGVYWKYPDNARSYSSWSDQYGGCLESNVFQINTHLIYPNQVQCNCPAATSQPPTNPSGSMTQATRQKLEVLRAQIQSWTPCAPDPDRPVADLFKPFTFQELKSCQSLRKSGKRGVFTLAENCFPGYFPGLEKCLYSGDHMANTVLSCRLGEESRCLDIKDSQDPVTGAWYRNPFHRRYPKTGALQPLFSRDAMMGMLSYIVTKRDKQALLKWLQFVAVQPKLMGGTFFNICPPRPNIPKPAPVSQSDWDHTLPDDRCHLVPSAAGLVYKVARDVGITQAEMQAISIPFFSALSSGEPLVETTLLGEAESAPAIGPSAYQIGLTFDAIAILQGIGGSSNGSLSSTLELALDAINRRTNQLNPGYHFFAEGRTATEYGAYLILKYCKAPRPQYGVNFETGWNGEWSNPTIHWNGANSIFYTNYQYLGGYGPYGGKNSPVGHECLDWLNMYLGNVDRTEARCNAGDSLINAACRKFAISAPALAPLAGIDYTVNPWTKAISYSSFDRKCQFGGSLTTHRCEITGSLSTTPFNTSVGYWVDPDPRWPGIYYQKISGACPHGGSSAGPNCQLKSYSPPVLVPGVGYWVTSSGASPGVYYNAVSSTCPYGGTQMGSTCRLNLFGLTLDPAKAYFVRTNPAYPGIYYQPEVVPEPMPTSPAPGRGRVE